MFDETLEGCSSFMVASTVFLRLLQSESQLMKEVIPSSHHTHVLDSFIKQPMDFFMSQGESLFQQARRNVAHHDYSVVLSCLSLLRHVKALLPEYKVVLQVSICVFPTQLWASFFSALHTLVSNEYWCVCVCVCVRACARVWSPSRMTGLCTYCNSLIDWYVTLLHVQLNWTVWLYFTVFQSLAGGLHPVYQGE